MEINRRKYIKILLVGIAFLIQYILLMKVGNTNKIIMLISKILYSIGSVIVVQQLFLSIFILFGSSYYIFIFTEIIDGVFLYLLNKYFLKGYIFIEIICFVIMFFYVISEVHGVKCIKQVKMLNEKMDLVIDEVKVIYKDRRILIIRYNNAVDRINENIKGYKKVECGNSKKWEVIKPIFSRNVFGITNIFPANYYLSVFKSDVDNFLNKIQLEINALKLENKAIEERTEVLLTNDYEIGYYRGVYNDACEYNEKNGKKIYSMKTIYKLEKNINSAEKKFVKKDKRERKRFEKFMKKAAKRRK